MQNEFDNVVDTLLRKAAENREAAAQFESHLDADEISMFAENALSGAGRTRAVSHLADCDRCRTILSNVVALNEEEGVEVKPVSAPVVNDESYGKQTGWYRLGDLFNVRNLAIAFGSLAVLFAGFLGFTALNNMSGGNEMARADREAAESADRNRDNANTVAPIAKSSDEDSADLNKTVEEPADADVTYKEDKNVPTGREVRRQVPKDPPKVDPGASRTEVLDGELDAMKRSPKAEDKDVLADDAKERVAATQPMATPKPPPVVAQESRPVLTTRGGKPTSIGRRNERADRAPVPNTGVVTKGNTVANAEKKKAPSTRVVAGKKFVRRDNAWYDSAYKKQPTTTVRRGSAEYGNLDSGLRSIGNQLPGTIYVIWKSKAYKIQ